MTDPFPKPKARSRSMSARLATEDVPVNVALEEPLPATEDVDLGRDGCAEPGALAKIRRSPKLPAETLAADPLPEAPQPRLSRRLPRRCPNLRRACARTGPRTCTRHGDRHRCDRRPGPGRGSGRDLPGRHGRPAPGAGCAGLAGAGRRCRHRPGCRDAAPGLRNGLSVRCERPCDADARGDPQPRRGAADRRPAAACAAIAQRSRRRRGRWRQPLPRRAPTADAAAADRRRCLAGDGWTEAPVAEPAPADPAMAGFRPRPRPEGLAPGDPKMTPALATDSADRRRRPAPAAAPGKRARRSPPLAPADRGRRSWRAGGVAGRAGRGGACRRRRA